MLSDTASSPAFRDLQRSLTRRRIARLDLLLRVELAVLAVIVAGFMFWQARVALASIAHDRGMQTAALGALVRWGLLCVLAAGLAGASHARQLSGSPPGPAWLTLPIGPRDLRAHLAWEARWHAVWVTPAAPALLAALVGLVPWWWLPPLAGLFALMLLAGAHAGVAAAAALPRRANAGRGLDPLLAALAVDDRSPARTASRRAGNWKRAPLWLALWHKDRRLGTRRTPALPRLVAAVLLLALSILCWRVGLETQMAHVLAFGLALAAAGSFGEWIIALGREDPFSVLRGLPISALSLWTSRMAWAALGAAAVAVAQAVAAHGLEAEAWRLLIGWLAGAALAIGALAVHYGITLFPRASIAQRLFSLTLGIAIAASLMIPLLGWITLLAALLHSARRLPHWDRLDETTA